VRDMHASMSADNLYLRFFSASKLAPEEEARRICREPAPDHAALLALLDGEVVGCGSVERGDEHSAARALGHAVRYGTWRAAPQEQAPDLDGVRRDLAENLVNGFLAGAPAGGWLPATVTAELLGCYGIPLADGNAVTTGNAAGVEVSLGVLQEQVFGPLVLFGIGGATADALADRSIRLAPLTGRDARQMIRPVRGALLLLGRPGTPVAGLAALEHAAAGLPAGR